MNLLTAFILTMGMGPYASAGVFECVASNSDGTFSTNLKIDYDRNNESVVFDKPVSWSKTDLAFTVIYSTYIGRDHLIVAEANEKKGSYNRQMIEILLDGTSGRNKGTLKAGDQLIPFRRLGKYQEYDLICN